MDQDQGGDLRLRLIALFSSTLKPPCFLEAFHVHPSQLCVCTDSTILIAVIDSTAKAASLLCKSVEEQITGIQVVSGSGSDGLRWQCRALRSAWFPQRQHGPQTPTQFQCTVQRMSSSPYLICMLKYVFSQLMAFGHSVGGEGLTARLNLQAIKSLPMLQ